MQEYRISDKVLQQLAMGDPEEYDKLQLIEDIVEYESMMYTLDEAQKLCEGICEPTLTEGIAAVKTSLRDRYRAFNYDKIKRIHYTVFIGEK